jgi:nicotinamidase-related amidase
MISNRKIMPASFHDDPPILVCADLQTEYLTEGRSHVISDAEAITARCLELMTLWRDNLWPVMHLKRIAQAAWFNPASNLTDWIAELKPRPGELAFEHPLPSAYSSTRFAEYMSNMRSIRCVLMGFSLDETVLSTVVDGFHRSHRYQVVSDAVACRRPGVGDAASYKLAVVKVISNFAGVVGTADLIVASGKIAV